MDDERNNLIDRDKTKNQFEEPSVLDWVKSLLRFRPIPIPEERRPDDQPRPADALPAKPAKRIRWTEEASDPAEYETPITLLVALLAQFRLPGALILALIAQLTLEWVKTTPNYVNNTMQTVVGFVCIAMYIFAGGLVLISFLMGDFRIKPLAVETRKIGVLAYRPLPFLLAVVFSCLTYIASREATFTLSTVIFWVAALVSALLAFWEGDVSLPALIAGVKERLPNRDFKITIDGWTAAILIGFGISLYFRLADLGSIPAEMVSDHAEKLLDIMDVLAGKTYIFFPRNTGREALQFYMGAAAVKWLGTDISYMTLKIGTVLAGIVTLPYIYLLGK